MIRRQHLATWRVNWNDKPQSIKEIAAELNIGRDSLVFIDDSPQECGFIKAAWPEVLVLQTPSNHENLVNFLHREYLFENTFMTKEDILRNKSYQENRDREHLLHNTNDLSEYKLKLETRLKVRKATLIDSQRISQMLQRTNQFNLTTHRYDQNTVSQMIVDSSILVICTELQDRFGDLGLIGLAIVRKQDKDAFFDTMLMSCRALGRDAEVAFASSVLKIIDDEWRVNRVMAEYIRSPKNKLVEDFWEKIGLLVYNDANKDPEERKLYISVTNLADLAKKSMPAHITVVIDGNQCHEY